MAVWPGVVAAISGAILFVWWLWKRPMPGCACGRCVRREQVVPRCVLSSTSSKAELEFRSGPMGGRSVVLDARYTAIGSVSSGGEGASIVLADPAVSQRHALIERKAGSFKLRDAGSTNGTYVNGLRHGELVLCGDDIIRIGNSEAVFRIT